MEKEKFIEVFEVADFRRWLRKNHQKEKKVGLILHKKHTGKNSPSHYDLMSEAICFGWIDTTIKRMDENRFIRFFSRRSKNSKWSYNTLSYGEKLLKEGRMSPYGLKCYEEGLQKKPHDYGIPKNPKIPSYLKETLLKTNLSKSFDSLSSSVKRSHLRYILRAKRNETRQKRIIQLIDYLKTNFKGR